jgi:5-formyltetrahydrofolate cyclo-ligase
MRPADIYAVFWSANLTDLPRDKKNLRAVLTNKRNSIASAERASAAKGLCKSTVAFTGLDSGTISGFYPIGSEIDARPLMTKLASSGFVTALPVIVDKEKPLIFRKWGPGEPLAKGVWDIPVPSEKSVQVSPDIVFVPLLGFDDEGYRIGYGGGFYDRTLAHLKQTKKIVAVGLAYASQHVPYIPREPHDVPLDWILTEEGPRDF